MARNSLRKMPHPIHTSLQIHRNNTIVDAALTSTKQRSKSGPVQVQTVHKYVQKSLTRRKGEPKILEGN
jgi:hypothetical protein